MCGMIGILNLKIGFTQSSANEMVLLYPIYFANNVKILGEEEYRGYSKTI